jgi:hypothetical protein
MWSSGEYAPRSRPVSFWRLATNLPRPRTQQSCKLLIQTAEWFLLIIGRLIRRGIQTNDGVCLAAPRSVTGNIQYEIMRIEARRRI